MKGIILAGGSGSRLDPLTKVVSKQLLPVYNKPLIFYPLSTLILAGIEEICVITTPEHLASFQQLLGNGSIFQISITYKVQEKPNGIAEAFLICEEWIRGEKVALILGDNIFHGPGLGRSLSGFANLAGAQLFGFRVNDPSRYGVVNFDDSGEICNIEEKPRVPKSNIAVTGLYFYDEKVSAFAKTLIPSARGELEITDLNNKYLENGELHLQILSSGTAWLDTGTFESLHDAGTYVRVLEERTGQTIGNPFFKLNGINQ